VAVTIAVTAAAVVGAVVLGRALTPLVPVGIGVFALIATWRAFGRRLLELVCAAVIALLALVPVAIAVRALLGLFGDWRLPIPAGLVLALVVFFGVAVWYLGGNWFGRRRDASGAPDNRPAPAQRHRFAMPSPRWGWRSSMVWAASLAIVVVLGLPVLVGVLEESRERPVANEQVVVSKIDAFIVADPARGRRSRPADVTEQARARLGPYAHAAGFDVRWSVGFATDDDGVRWTLAGSASEADAIAALADPDAPAVPKPGVLNDADRVLLLLVDGTPAVLDGDPANRPSIDRDADGAVARWRRVAAAGLPSGTPTYALLETTNDERIEEGWARFIRPQTAVRRGAVISLQQFGSRTVTDTAVRLAIGAPTAQEDYSLALRYRPILRFDEAEQAPRPLSVEALFATKKVRICSANRRPEDLAMGRLGEECSAVTDPRQLANDGDPHLELPLDPARKIRDVAKAERAELQRRRQATPTPAGAPAGAPAGTPLPAPPTPSAGGSQLGKGSAIYVHPVPADTEDASFLYLDYWWYLPYNPAESGAGAFCGPGFVIPGISCFNHVSDWEGVTVVLKRTGPTRVPDVLAVHYAQHSGVARYAWKDLRTAWERDADARGILAETPNSDTRPLVFVARGTHASYPRPCRGGCDQVIEDAEEKPHDGRMPWAGNTVPLCGAEDCLKLLPTARGGRTPALWNGFVGRWGTRHCWLTYYCDSGSPPEAPGRQPRYQRPWENDGTYPPAAGRPGSR
jgi:hypothetical protein